MTNEHVTPDQKITVMNDHTYHSVVATGKIGSGATTCYTLHHCNVYPETVDVKVTYIRAVGNNHSTTFSIEEAREAIALFDAWQDSLKQ